MLNVLSIEDEKEYIQSTIDLAEELELDIEFCVIGFEHAKNKIEEILPDIVVLDILLDGASPEPIPEGWKPFDFIWNERFCPIIIYSAEPERFREEYPEYIEHPFVEIIEKGRDSDEEVLNAIEKFDSHVASLREAEIHIRQQFSFAMRDVAPYAFNTFPDIRNRKDVIIRASGRRFAALMDEPLGDRKALATWEQYLFPPVSDDLQLGDVLRAKDGSPDDPVDFRIILTPSCDLVSSETRKPKVTKVLLARCCSVQKGLEQIGLSANSSRLRDRILTQGYSQNIIPFPKLSDRIPTMAANLKDLELIPFGDVKHLYCRVASVDSPFREMIAWAYLQTAGRPGLPDRDFESWTNEIVEDTRNQGGGESK